MPQEFDATHAGEHRRGRRSGKSDLVRAPPTTRNTRSQHPLSGILPRPLTGRRLVPGAVGLVYMGDLGDERVVRVRVRQHRADRQQHFVTSAWLGPDLAAERIEHTFGHCQRRAPLVSENVEADAAVGVDVGVVDSGGEVDLGRLEGVVGREVDGEEEDAPSIWRFRLQEICQPRSVACSFGMSCSGVWLLTPHVRVEKG